MTDAGFTHPSVDLALVATHDGVDVVLQHSSQLSRVVDVGDPSRQLGMPDHIVAADNLVVCCGPVDQVVGSGETELVLDRLRSVPLHAVLRRDLTEVLFIGRGIDGVAEGALVGAGAPVAIASLIHADPIE